MSTKNDQEPSAASGGSDAGPPAKVHRCIEGKNHRYQRAPLGCKLCGKTTREIHRLRAKWVNEMYAWRRRQNKD